MQDRFEMFGLLPMVKYALELACILVEMQNGVTSIMGVDYRLDGFILDTENVQF